MKILWIDLNSSYAHSSLALPALHAQMAADDAIEWAVVSATINEPPGTIADAIYRHRPDILAATVWLFNHEALMHVCSRVKALLPQVCLILGGPEFLGDNESFLRSHPLVSCVFRGEGEEEFPRWLARYRQQESWGEVKGLCYIDHEGRYRDNGTARVADFSSLMPPETSRFFNWEKPFVQLETTRGCFNTCAFCVSGGEKPVRSLPVEAIRQRLLAIHSHGIRDVRLLDRTFNYNPRRARELLELFTSFPDMRFHLEIHPALLTNELKALLRQMPKGLLHLEAGIQSLRQEVLVQSHRAGRLEEALEGLRFLCSLDNMETHADLIAGLPLYSLKELVEDIHTLATYQAGEIQLESLKLLPGTEMRRRAEEWGITHSSLPPYEVLQTREISSEELQTARRLSRLLDAFYNTPAWQSLTRSLMAHDQGFLMAFLKHLTDDNLIDQPMSLEKRGLLLYDYCRMYHTDFLTAASTAWIEAGMSLKKRPAERVRTRHLQPPEHWRVLQGEYKGSLRLCFLPTGETETSGYWYGYESEAQVPRPVFKAVTE
ncbi:MAG: DUF4080 domain-containing protein [Bacteroides sp.]|nr:DUF4080 domain-containing protein [Bacteroides sp.]